jgi:hypothetical protein
MNLCRVDNFKRAGGTFEISRLLFNAPQAHTSILILNRPLYFTNPFFQRFCFYQCFTMLRAATSRPY